MPSATERFSSMTDDMKVCYDMAAHFNRPQVRPRTRSSGVSLGMQRTVSLPALAQRHVDPPSTSSYKAVHATEEYHKMAALPDILPARRSRRVTGVQNVDERDPYPYFASPTFNYIEEHARMHEAAAVAGKRGGDGVSSTERLAAAAADDPFRAYVLRKNKKSHLIHPPKLRPLQSHSVRKL